MSRFFLTIKFEQDIQDTAGEVMTNSYATFSSGTLQMEEQVLHDLQELI